MHSYEILLFTVMHFSITRAYFLCLQIHFEIPGGGIVFGVLPVLHARVPVLKVIDRGTGVECDISVENKDGITRSRIFSLVSSIDERFRILSYLVV